MGRAKYYDNYYYIDENGEITVATETGDEEDGNRYAENNYFLTLPGAVIKKELEEKNG